MPTLLAHQVEAALRRGTSTRGPVDIPPRFTPGQRVLARNIHPRGHTRIPRYVRGRRGVIQADHGAFIFPDSHTGENTDYQHVYSVRFEAQELWGEHADSHSAVYVDLWDDYLEALP